MMAANQVFVSVRSEPTSVHVTATITFAGPAATHERVQRLFAAPLKAHLVELCGTASTSMDAEDDETEKAVRVAMSEAIENLADPQQRELARTRFGLEHGGLTS